MASRGVHCRDPGLKVAACADGPDVQNSSGWPCQWVFLSCPLHLLWPHSGWYIIAVVLGVPRAAGCLLCYVAVVLGCLLSLAASVVSGADGLPLVSPASPCAAAGPLFLRSRPSVAEQSATPEALIPIAATSGPLPSPAVFYCSVSIVIGSPGHLRASVGPPLELSCGSATKAKA